ncbi:MAG TPA: FAD-dependent oxidoreductase [Cellulomonas sp.]
MPAPDLDPALDLGPAVPAPVAPPVPDLTHVVVVGAGLAGARTMVELRAQGFTGRVTVLGAETVPPYDRPPLSKHLVDRPAPAWLSDELAVDALGLADAVRLGTPATGLEVADDGVVVRVVDGEVTADAVVLATGAAAVRPAVWDGVRTLHTAADARALRDGLGLGVGSGGTGGRRLVVIGAGWIGAEVATVAAAAGVDVTVVEALATPLSGALGKRVGALTVPWFAAAGVHLVTGVPVASVGPLGSTDGTVVALSDGTVLTADVVLAAVGARPATGWIGDALPREPGGAVRVDEGHAPVGGSARVRAVGDVALRRSARHGWVPGGHWDAALRGPAVAVGALLGTADPAATDLAPYVFSTQLGHELGLYGLPGAADEVLLRGDPAGPTGAGWSALWFAPGTDRLTAVLAVDRPRDVAGARRLFGRAELPVLDRARATDPGVLLPATVRD